MNDSQAVKISQEMRKALALFRRATKKWGVVTISDLKQELGISDEGARSLIRRLEPAGLIERMPSRGSIMRSSKRSDDPDTFARLLKEGIFEGLPKRSGWVITAKGERALSRGRTGRPRRLAYQYYRLKVLIIRNARKNLSDAQLVAVFKLKAQVVEEAGNRDGKLYTKRRNRELHTCLRDAGKILLSYLPQRKKIAEIGKKIEALLVKPPSPDEIAALYELLAERDELANDILGEGWFYYWDDIPTDKPRSKRKDLLIYDLLDLGTKAASSP